MAHATVDFALALLARDRAAALWRFPERRVDSVLTEVTLSSGLRGIAERVGRYEIKPRSSAQVDTTWLLEFSLGYSHFSGFHLQGVSVDSLELVGAIRELPSVWVYGTNQEWLGEDWGFYLGVGFGLAQLHGLHAYAPDADTTRVRPYTGSASTFELGGGVGLVYQVTGSVGLFTQASYVWRDFEGVDWVSLDKSASVPRILPSRLNASSFSLSLGIQVRVRP